MNDQETRIRQAAEVLRRHYERPEGPCTCSPENVARRMLWAADAPPKPEWPTDATLSLIRDAKGSRDGTREAMLADPIIQAAVKVRDGLGDAYPGSMMKPLIDAVNEAGLA